MLKDQDIWMDFEPLEQGELEAERTIVGRVLVDLYAQAVPLRTQWASTAQEQEGECSLPSPTCCGSAEERRVPSKAFVRLAWLTVLSGGTRKGGAGKGSWAFCTGPEHPKRRRFVEKKVAGETPWLCHSGSSKPAVPFEKYAFIMEKMVRKFDPPLIKRMRPENEDFLGDGLSALTKCSGVWLKPAS